MMSLSTSRSAAAMRMRPSVASRPMRGNLHVVAAKGGEEGGKTFDKSVYGTIAGNANYAILGSAIAKAGLDKVLSGPGPFTLFAPDDDAFADAARALKISKIELLNLPNLADILKYHVIAGEVKAASLSEGAEVKTVNGQSVKFSLSGGAKVNGAKIKKTDVKASNGIIHAVGAVLLPK